MARLPLHPSPSPTLPDTTPRQLASDALGFDHPLTRACDALDATLRQLLVVVAVLAGSVAAVIEKAFWARSLALAAAIVLLAVAAIAAIRNQSRRDLALDLILEGRETLPVAVVQRQRQRLASTRTRRTLARTFESMIDETLNRQRLAIRGARPLLHVRLIKEAQHDMRLVAQLLRADGATVRGVAFSERMITHCESPLYGSDAAALRAQLRRACELLRSRD